MKIYLVTPVFVLLAMQLCIPSAEGFGTFSATTSVAALFNGYFPWMSNGLQAIFGSFLGKILAIPVAIGYYSVILLSAILGNLVTTRIIFFPTLVVLFGIRIIFVAAAVMLDWFRYFKMIRK